MLDSHSPRSPGNTEAGVSTTLSYSQQTAESPLFPPTPAAIEAASNELMSSPKMEGEEFGGGRTVET